MFCALMTLLYFGNTEQRDCFAYCGYTIVEAAAHPVAYCEGIRIVIMLLRTKYAQIF